MDKLQVGIASVLEPMRLETPVNTRETVVRILRKLILVGHLQPGQRLKEVQVGQYLNISRQPVREAFGILEAEGLIRHVPNRGAVVAEFSLEDVEEIYHLRALLEGIAAEKAAGRLIAANLSRMEEVIQELEHSVEMGNYKAVGVLNVELHSMIWEAAGRTLEGLCKSLFHRVPKDIAWVIPERARESVGEHRAIVEALAKRDGAKARQLMCDHLERSLSIMVEHLQKLKEHNKPGEPFFERDRVI